MWTRHPFLHSHTFCCFVGLGVTVAGNRFADEELAEDAEEEEDVADVFVVEFGTYNNIGHWLM